MRVYCIYGQGGIILSGGFYLFSERLKNDFEGYDVKRFAPGDWQFIVDDIEIRPRDEKIALIGYSLGANTTAWIAREITRTIDLIVAYDPTINGPPLASYPLGPHVKRAISYRQTGWLVTSLFFGRGVLVGPQVEVVNIVQDHVYVQFSQRLHRKTIKALEQAKLQ